MYLYKPLESNKRKEETIQRFFLQQLSLASFYSVSAVAYIWKKMPWIYLQLRKTYVEEKEDGTNKNQDLFLEIYSNRQRQ